jgi:two-component system, chemotaxis family, response regulator Rcp1
MKSVVEVLLVEDDPADIRLMREAFIDTNIDVRITTKNDGEQALMYLKQLAKESRVPDIILLDLNMPIKNGHDVLTEIKSAPDFKNVPIVVVSASRSDEDLLRALETRMNYYMNKPVSSDKLQIVLETLFHLWQPSSQTEGNFYG